MNIIYDNGKSCIMELNQHSGLLNIVQRRVITSGELVFGVKYIFGVCFKPKQIRFDEHFLIADDRKIGLLIYMFNSLNLYISH